MGHADSDLGSRPDTGPASYIGEVDLAGLDELPVTEHAAVYDGLHDRLQEALTSLDEI